jgi:hypothetical protein
MHHEEGVKLQSKNFHCLFVLNKEVIHFGKKTEINELIICRVVRSVPSFI